MPLHVVALMEASTVTGPAKNLIRFSETAIARGDLRFTVLTIVRGPNASSNPFIDAARASGIPVEIIRERFPFDPKIVPQLREAIRRLRPDIVQTHGVKGHFLLALLGSEAPWIAFHHGYTAENLKMRLYNQLNRWSLPRAGRVITVCGPFAETLERAGVNRDRLRVVPNSIEQRTGLDPSEGLRLRERLTIEENEAVILAVGRFSREKGHADLIEAAGMLRSRNPGCRFRLLLVGDGIERGTLERKISEQGLTNIAILAGHQRDPSGFFGIANLFVLPSWSEGSPNVLLEAMGAGLPIVATKVGGVPETIDDGVEGLLVPPHQPQALSAAMEQLLLDRTLASTLADSARQGAARFSPSKYRESLMKIYRDVVGSLPRK
jgi:glycosyltransferase involved in cell wall biosynthesis